MSRGGVSGMVYACCMTNGIETKSGALRGCSGLLEPAWLATLAAFLACVAFLVRHQLLAGRGLREVGCVRALAVN
jgi:hypothetical protein